MSHVTFVMPSLPPDLMSVLITTGSEPIERSRQAPGRLAPGGALAPGQRHEDVVIVRAHTRGSRHRRPG
jgi:hypothetical protein